MAPPWTAVVRIAFVIVAVQAFWTLPVPAVRVLDDALGPAVLKILLWVVPSLLLAMLIGRQAMSRAWESLGLHGQPWRGLAFGVLATLPMAMLLAIGRGRQTDVSILAADSIVGPFAEEVLFRGFLFLGLRRLGWRFWPSAMASSLLFGLAHVTPLWQIVHGGWRAEVALQWLGNSAGYISMQILAISAGGLFFAWIVEKRWSLWPAFGLHAAINFWSVIIWGAEPPRHANYLSPESMLWALASCASLVIAVLITRHLGRVGRVVMSHGRSVMGDGRAIGDG